MNRPEQVAKLRNAPYHEECLFALVRPVIKNGHASTVMCYTLGKTKGELWQSIIDADVLGSGQTKEALRKRGWRPVAVFVRERVKL
jgi:hypothetical protein